jgi:zinc/manganese transport system substrate-binding protein
MSILSDPTADPHEYENNVNDAKAVYAAQFVLKNGAGYDAWMNKLLAASPNSSRVVLDVADMLGKQTGDNPHFWYRIDWVIQLANQVTRTLKSLDPADSDDFDTYRQAFVDSLGPIQDKIAAIKASYAGAHITQTERVAGYMAADCGLNVDEGEFQQAIEDGNDPSPQSVAELTREIQGHQVRALLYNSQTVTPITENIKSLAKKNNVPVVGVAETLPPNEPNYQQWQIDQLNALQKALGG